MIKVKDTSRLPQLYKEIEYLNNHALKIGVLGEEDSEMLKIAGIHEFGGTIKPKNAKALAIPLPIANGTRPSDHSDLFIPKGKNILAKKKGNDGFTPFFILVQSVTIPERSYIRSTFDENKEDIATAAQKLLEGVMLGKLTGEDFYNRLGLYLKSMVQNKIRDIKNPPNASITVSNKGRNNPLIDSGRLRQSINYEVVKA